MPSRNLYKCKNVVYVIVVCGFCLRLSLQCWLLLPVRLLACAFFKLMFIPYFCLFVDNVNKSIVFLFIAFVHHFNVKRCNTISIFVTICMYICILSLHEDIHIAIQGLSLHKYQTQSLKRCHQQAEVTFVYFRAFIHHFIYIISASIG